ncbi:MAG TPA: hypothetical protein VLD86_15275, partial [Ilumatobacteraceae bacterium]|nr:hypothetical protein [Ilumatobacteraceae bacterium]
GTGSGENVLGGMERRGRDLAGKIENPPAIRRGVRASANLLRLPYIRRRRVRQVDIATSVPGLTGVVNVG